MTTTCKPVLSAYNPTQHPIRIKSILAKGAEINRTFCRGYEVHLGGYVCEHLAQATRHVYLCRELGVVVKVGSLRQSWAEFHTYHEVLDDTSREHVPTVHHFQWVSADEMGGHPYGNQGVVVQDYVVGAVSRYGGDCTDEARDLADEVCLRFRSLHGVTDLHGENCGWSQDGKFWIWDLGLNNDTDRNLQAASARSPKVRECVSALPRDARSDLALV